MTYRSDRKPPDLDWDQVEVHRRPMANCGNSPTTSRSTDCKNLFLFQDNSEEPKCITH